MVHQLAMFITPPAFLAEQKALFVESDPHPRPAPEPAPEPEAPEATADQYRAACDLWAAILEMDEQEDARVAAGRWARTESMQEAKSRLIAEFEALPRIAQDAAVNGDAPPEPEPAPEAAAPTTVLKTCKVGRGGAVHLIRVAADGTVVGWPCCGQPRKLSSAIHSVGIFAPATCRRCVGSVEPTLDTDTDASAEEVETVSTTDAEPEAGDGAAATTRPMVKICLRDREWNAKGNGTEDHRRVLTPDGRGGWAADIAENITGSWHSRPSGMMRANERKCQQRGELPEGTLVASYERTFRGGKPTGPAEVDAGVVDASESRGIRWGLRTRKSGDAVEVQIDGEWNTV